MLKSCAKDLMEYIFFSNIFFVVIPIMLWMGYGINLKSYRLAVDLSIPCFICSVLAYKKYLHDIIFKRIEIVDACIYGQQKYITQDERRSLLAGSKGHLPKKQFRLLMQDVDEDGNLMEFKYRWTGCDTCPEGNELMSYDFKLYDLLREKSRQIPKIKISKKREPYRYKKEMLLYARISYMKTTNMIVDIEFLGQKMNKVGG